MQDALNTWWGSVEQLEHAYANIDRNIDLPDRAQEAGWKRLSAFNEVFSIRRNDEGNGYFAPQTEDARGNRILRQTRWGGGNNVPQPVHPLNQEEPVQVENNAENNIEVFLQQPQHNNNRFNNLGAEQSSNTRSLIKSNLNKRVSVKSMKISKIPMKKIISTRFAKFNIYKEHLQKLKKLILNSPVLLHSLRTKRTIKQKRKSKLKFVNIKGKIYIVGKNKKMIPFTMKIKKIRRVRSTRPLRNKKNKKFSTKKSTSNKKVTPPKRVSTNKKVTSQKRVTPKKRASTQMRVTPQKRASTQMRVIPQNRASLKKK